MEAWEREALDDARRIQARRKAEQDWRDDLELAADWTQRMAQLEKEYQDATYAGAEGASGLR